jgi:predicted ATP-dependent endonuclease of OLD family
MKIKTVYIKNLRAIKEETVDFDDYTCFVGANGAGKSTVLLALNVFFRDNEGTSTDVTSLSIEDFH